MTHEAAATRPAIAAPPDTHPARWRALALLAAAELLGMSLWFAASATSGQYAARWGLTSSEAAWLTTVVQVGFVVGTAASALLNLADVVPARRLFAAAAVAGALANGALLTAPDYRVALAGVYPPAMKMVATWFRARRGLAVGAIVGALTVGKATPYLVRALPGADARDVVIATSAAALLAAALVGARYRDGPYPFPARPFSWGLASSIVRTRRWRLATGGYLGHMWELYAAWTWLPAFIAASEAARTALPNETPGQRPSALPDADAAASAVAFAALAAGGAGCVWGGLVADRRGRAWLVTAALAASGACALAIGLTFGRALWLVAPAAVAWGFFVVADSAQFSALVTESVPPHAVGTALTLQTSLGFLLTAVTVQLVPVLAESVGWRWAFTILAAGPAFGVWSVRRLVRPSQTLLE